MAVLGLQDASGGGQITLSAASSDDEVPGGTIAANWGLNVFLLVRNASAVTARTVTVDGHPEVEVPTSGFAVIPVNAGVAYGTLKTVVYSGTADVTVAAVRLSGAVG